MGFRINLLLKDEEAELIYNFIKNKSKGIEDALKIAIKDEEWRENHLMKIDREMFEKMVSFFESNNLNKDKELTESAKQKNQKNNEEINNNTDNSDYIL